MEQEHPITPPPELVIKAATEAIRQSGALDWAHAQPRGTAWCIAENAVIAGYAAGFCAGSDQELEACCEWLDFTDCDNPQEMVEELSSARRPKPLSLKQQALEALDSFEGFTGSLQEVDTIRRALEALPD